MGSGRTRTEERGRRAYGCAVPSREVTLGWEDVTLRARARYAVRLRGRG